MTSANSCIRTHWHLISFRLRWTRGGLSSIRWRVSSLSACRRGRHAHPFCHRTYSVAGSLASLPAGRDAPDVCDAK